MSHETQTTPPQQTPSDPAEIVSNGFDPTPSENTWLARAQLPSPEEYDLAATARAEQETRFQQQWNALLHQRLAEGKSASYRYGSGRHLTILPIVEILEPTESPVATVSELPPAIRAAARQTVRYSQAS